MSSSALKETDSLYDTMISAVINSVFLVAALIALSPVFEKIMLPNLYRYTQSQSYSGITDPRTLLATPTIKSISLITDPPYTPWISAYFINDGPDPVYIGINDPDNRFIMNPNETVTVNRAGAQERIETIYYICDPGGNASVRVIGEY